jgi:peptide deformylase
LTVACATGGALWLLGCGAKTEPPRAAPLCPIKQTASPWAPEKTEATLWLAARPDFDLVTRQSQNPVLRRRASELPAELPAPFDVAALAERMRATMAAAKGVGIAAPQVGLGVRLVVLSLDYRTPNPFVVVAKNPRIVERSDETLEGYEGCLSVPDVGGLVRRNRAVKVTYETLDNDMVTREDIDHNAVLWQHELDHLEGVLYVDRLLGELLPREEMRRRRDELERQRAGAVSSSWATPLDTEGSCAIVNAHASPERGLAAQSASTLRART